MSRKLLFCLLFVVSQARASDPGVQTYEVPHYPRGTSDCDTLARGVADRLHAAGGVTIVRAAGAAEGAALCGLSVTYVSPEPLPLVSTSPRSEALEMQDRWHYASLNDCASDVPVQAPLFEEQTKLKPLVAYCYATTLFEQGAIYVMKVEALGHPAKRPASFTLPKAYEEQERMDEEVAAAIRARGGVLARLAASPSPLSPREVDTIHYYTDHWLGLQSLAPTEASPAFPDTQLRFRTDEECAAQLGEAERVAKALGATPVSHACVGRRHHAGKYSQLEFLIATSVYPVKARFPKDSEYASLESCLADRDRTIEIYRKELHLDVRGALCMLYFDVLRTYYRMALYLP